MNGTRRGPSPHFRVYRKRGTYQDTLRRRDWHLLSVSSRLFAEGVVSIEGGVMVFFRKVRAREISLKRRVVHGRWRV